MASVPKKIRRLAVALVAGVAAMGGVIAITATSSADVSTAAVALASAGGPTTVLGGVANQPANGWSITLQVSTLAQGDQLHFVVNPFGFNGSDIGCAIDNDIEFSQVPAVTVTTKPGLLTGKVPTFAASLSTESDAGSVCQSDGLDNELTLAVTGPGAAGILGPSTWTVVVSNVDYTVGIGAALGPVSMADSSYQDANLSSVVEPALVPSNATVSDVAVTANNPPVGLVVTADTDAAISPISFTETVPGMVKAGYTCVALDQGTFNLLGDGLPTIAAAGGGATVNSTVEDVAPNEVAFDVTLASSSAPATYSLGNIYVDGGSLLGPVGIVVTTGALANCTGGDLIVTNGVRAFDVLNTTHTYGQTADDTAAAEMETVFPPAVDSTGCPLSKTVVLATDENFPDALSASYLAGQLNTGILLTPTDYLSDSAASAIRLEGIQTVDVVGGMYAISSNVINTLQASPVYNCGGETETSLGENITVQVIEGPTEYDTSADIAQYFAKQDVGQAAFPGAYGSFNDTTGGESASGPTSAVPTAIVATGESFEDATAASVMGYAKHFPVILTTGEALSSQAQTALVNDNIQQVILVGGPDAVSDATVASIEGLGIDVLRIAGQDYTDTAQELARFELNSSSNSAGPEGLGWDNDGANQNEITLARGDFYTDGLAGAPFAAHEAAGPQPILLTLDPYDLGVYLPGFLESGGSEVGATGDGENSVILTVNVLGGMDAVAPETVTQALNDISQG
jgi:putative cell wall-binding protein